MKIRMTRRILALALAFVMVIGLLPSVAFARTAGKDGSAAMNEDYEAKKSLMPIGPSFSTYTILEWTAESDPDAAYSRASIPLKERKGGFVVNPLANPEAKLMLCSLANSDHDHTSAQGTESFLSYSFNYWQYVDSFVYWSGSQEGLIVVPTGEFIDAAHTNGVPVVATLGFPWGSGSGYVQEVSDFCQKAADGSFPVADKMIEVMDYYGFDGYFFNQESYGCSEEIARRMDEMIHYMHAKRPDMLISWYDSMTKYGGVSYVNGVNDSNKHWMAYDENGVVGVDEFFMNYNWGSGTIATTISSMKSIGRSQFDAFAGIDVQQNCMDTYFADHLLVDEDGQAKLSLALYCPNSTLGLSADGAQFHEVERTFYTNAKEDPRDTSIDVTDSSEYRWAGMSRLFADKTPITSAPFVTDFNSGHGTGYFVDGVLSRDAEWSYQSNQDVMPTWTWIIDSNGEQKLEGDYDFTDAYNGGTSIKFSGTIDASNMIKLYSTHVEITDGMTVSMTAKGGLEDAYLVVYVGDADAKSYMDCDRISTMFEDTEGWATTEALLGSYAGKILYGIGLDVDGAQTDYEINVGRVSIIDKDRSTLNGPASVTLDEILYTDAYTAEARIQWSKVTGAASYEIYKVHGEEKSLIMETPSTAFYIPTLKRAADEENVTIEIVPINRNGVRGKGTQFVIDWAYGNDDSDEVVVQNFENVALNATVTGVSFENSGEPAAKALDGTAANNSKWCATNYGSGWMTIDIGRQVTVKRWRVEHAEYGGEANNMNTIDFALEYKDPASNSWVQVKRIQNNHDAVTDVLLDTPVTAQEWKLQIYDDGSSPWGGIRIYEWQMFESDQFPQTDVVPMHFASAVNGVGAADTFTLKHVPANVTVKVYNAAGDKLGEAVSDGESDVVISGLDFGAEAGRVFYTTTSSAAAESAKLSAPFEAENAEKSAPAEDVSFVTFSQPGSVTSSNGNDVYTTLTVNGLNEGDVVYVYENGADAEYTKVSLPVAEGETSVSVNRVLVPRAGGVLTLRVKRVGCLLSDAYGVQSPTFGLPTASLRVYAKNEVGESLTGVRFELRDAEGNVVAQFSTTSDSGASATVALGSYTLYCTDAPEGYAIPAAQAVNMTTEGAAYELEVVLSEAGEEPDPTDPPVVVDPADDSRDIPLSLLTVSTGNFEPNGGASEGPAELAVDGDTGTIWHTDWYGTSRDDHWFQFEIDGDYNVDGLRLLPRQTGNTNGIITEYDIQVSEDGETFHSIAIGEWAADREWKLVQFPDARVKFVRMYALDGVTDNAYVFASAAEIRITGEEYVDPMPPVMEPGDDSWDIPLAELEVSCGDYEPNGGSTEGPAELAVDENPATMWHTDWQGTSRENHWFQFEVTGDYTVCGLRYLPRQTGNENGTITEYQILVSDDGENFTLVAEGNWEANSSWKISQFRGVKAKYVRLVSVDAVTDNSWVFASAAELRLTYLPTQTGNADKAELNALIAECELIEEGNYTAKTWQQFQKALTKAQTVAASPYASQAQVDEAYQNLLQAKEGLKEKVEGEGPQIILHLDSGRKYFSKDWHIALLNELAAAGYTHVQLAFGNNGLRFVLDDMTIEANGTTYDSDALKEGIRQGNYNYGAQSGYYVDGAEYLTETEMDEIIAHAKSVGVEIIPHLNMPGHMSALLDAMEYVGIEDPNFYGRTESDSSVDLTNEEAINFMYALTEKYAAYFAEHGVKYFHIGADEYANDAYNGNMGFPSMGADLYQKFADFVNHNAEIVKSHGMTPRAWNDGLYYGSYTSEFDDEIEINYWSSGWWGYTLAKASTLNDKGHGLINTNGDYYFILGKDDRFTPGASTEHDPYEYDFCANFNMNRFMDGSIIEEPVGGMFCIWADYPGAETEQEVAANIRLILRAMALGMEGLDLDGMNTDVIPGGFNEDGSINGAEQPHEHAFGEWTTVTEPTCTDKGLEERKCECGETETREIAALGHSAAEAVKENEVAPTCTENGSYDNVVYCSVCNEELSRETVTVDALGHDFVNGECSRCDAEMDAAFEDVPVGSFYFDPVQWAVDEEITAGTTPTTFDPNGKCMRAVVVTFLWKAAGSPEPKTTENPFTDVKESSYYYKAVLWAYENKVTAGLTATTFGPTALCNRAQVVTFLYNAMGRPEVKNTEHKFTDVDEGKFYYTPMLWAVENGITAGLTETTFGPNAICNRAQVVTFLYRLYNK